MKIEKAYRVFASLLIGGLLSACSAPTQDGLRRVVEGQVRIEDDLSSAEANLRRAGFSCGPSYVDNFDGRLCDRTVSGPLLSGCVERVGIVFDRASRKVRQVDVQPPACAGP